MLRSGATFADAAAEYLRYIGEDRNRKASTVEDYRSIIRTHLLPAFGEERIEDITPVAVEAFQAALAKREHRGHLITPRTRNKVLNVLHRILARARCHGNYATTSRQWRREIGTERSSQGARLGVQADPVRWCD